MMGEHPSDARLLLALDGELEPRDAALITDHVRTCAACRATWERFEALSGDIERYCRTQHVEQLVAAAASATPHRWQERPPDAAPWQRPSLRVLSQSAALAAAAALLLIAGAAWLLWPHAGSRSDGDGQVAAVIPVLPAPARSGDINLASASESAPAPPRAAARAMAARPIETRTVARARAPQAPQTPARRNTPTYYWSLPYSNVALPLSEGSVVMTVRLSRDQLRLAGIPVSGTHAATRDNSLVRAKVLVGADGQPRAIAFDQNQN